MKAYNQQDIANLSYHYQNDGQLSELTDELRPAYSQNFKYDAAHRLTVASGPYGDQTNPRRDLTYRYAALGPLLYNGENSQNLNYTDPQNPHQLVQTGNTVYTYDNRGNVQTKQQAPFELTFTHTPQNRPATVQIENTDGLDAEVSFLYDDRGERFRKNYRIGETEINTYYLDTGYQIRTGGADELHTLIVRKPDGLLATFTFGYELASNESIAGIIRRHLPAVFLSMLQAAKISVAVPLFFACLLPLLYLRHRQQIGPILACTNRSIALALCIVLFAQFSVGCVATEIFMLSSAPEFLPGYVSDQIGAHYYISDHLHSNRIVTNEQGTVVANYIYLPYGRLNMQLSNADTDGDGRQFNLLEKYTGQEYDYETGLYNYHARLYDPESTRFLQTDPSHKSLPGWNTYDPYSYVHGNPINLTDPSGAIAWQVLLNNMAGGLRWAAKNSARAANIAGANIVNTAKIVGTHIGNATRRIGHDIHHGCQEIITGGAHRKHQGSDLGVFGRKMIEFVESPGLKLFAIALIAIVGAYYLYPLIATTLYATGYFSPFFTKFIAGSVTSFLGAGMGRTLGGYSDATWQSLGWNSRMADQGEQVGNYASSISYNFVEFSGEIVLERNMTGMSFANYRRWVFNEYELMSGVVARTYLIGRFLEWAPTRL